MKIIMTLGPSSSDESIISHMLTIADKFRLNASHLNLKSYKVWIKKLYNLFQEKNRIIPVVIDLQGAKMRIGDILPCESLLEEIFLFLGTSSRIEDRIPVPNKRFFESIKVNDVITLNDCKVEIQIEHIKEYQAKARVIKNGPLSSNKGINRKEHPILFDKISEKDLEIINISQKYNFIEYAFSFLLDGKESVIIKPLIGNKNLIAKIERPEAIDNLYSIDRIFDEIWFCRGDLGAQAGVFNLGKIQQDFIKSIGKLRNKCYLAGQVLEHMTENKQPTRSEIVHLNDIINSGFEGIVLSDETAIGRNINDVVKFLEDFKLYNKHY